MIPFPPTPAAAPATPGTSGGVTTASPRSRGSQDLGTVPEGLFAEVFASMIPSAQSHGNRESAAGTEASQARTEDTPPGTGKQAFGNPVPWSGEPEPVEADAQEVQTTGATAPDPGPVMSQRAQHPALSAPATRPVAGSLAPPVAGSAPVPASLAGASASAPQPGIPVAVAPLPAAPLSAGISVPEAPSLPVAQAPLLVIELPAGGASLPVAPTPGALATAPTLPATLALQPAAVHSGTQAKVPAPDSALVGTQPEPAAGEEARTGDTAAPAAADPVLGPPPAAATSAMAEAVPAGHPEPLSIPVAAGQPAAGTAAGDDTAFVSRDGGISAVNSIETPGADGPQVRTQAPAPLHRQLLLPLATLAAGPNGERTLSVNIAPEALGPITVKALLGGDGIRMELSAPTDAGREALRAMLPELRRELAAAGSGSITLTAGADSSATSGGFAGNQGTGGSDARPFAGTAPAGVRTRDEPAPETPGQETPPARHDTSHLDVMA